PARGPRTLGLHFHRADDVERRRELLGPAGHRAAAEPTAGCSALPRHPSATDFDQQALTARGFGLQERSSSTKNLASGV
ncbi:MAG: hypothetical protein ACTHOU_19100, partial [Aureliella sp.]